MEYAADEDGKIRGVRAKLVVGLGAYLQLVTAGTPILGGWVYGGPYDIEAYSLEVVGAFTTATPTDAYRGAGRPEATFLIERTVDALARKLDMDPAELRRKNFITEFPYTLASGLDSRLGRLRRRARPGARDGRLRRAAQGAGRASRCAATRRSSASASPPTPRCAVSRRRASSARSSTPPVAGTRPRSAASRPGASRSSSAPRRTARAT